METDALAVHGSTAPGFEDVREEFRAVLAAEPLLGAQLAAYVGDQRVVDLWGGPGVRADSLIGVYSSTKGAAHLAVALLVQEDTLDLDREVAHYWPEFAVHGKGDITVRDLLAHRAGLVGDPRGLPVESLHDDRVTAERLGAQRPLWRPGTAFGYHALTIAALSGELVRRTTGATLQEFHEKELRQRYGVDFYMGLPAEEEHRVLDTHPMSPTPQQHAELVAAEPAPHSVYGLAFNLHVPGTPEVWELPNSRTVRAAGPGSYGGVASARGLAELYAGAVTGGVPASGSASGEPLLTADTLATFGQVHSSGTDLVMGDYREFGVGFQTYTVRRPYLGHGSIGHTGAAGSVALADPQRRLTIGYTRRRMVFPPQAQTHSDRMLRALATHVPVHRG